MSNYYKIAFCWFCRNTGLTAMALLLSMACYAQGELQHLPLGIMPMQLNSSFAGDSEGPRLNTAFSYKKQRELVFANLPTDFQFISGFASYDQYIPALKSGIGVSINRGRNSISSGQSDNNPDSFFGLQGLEGELDHQSIIVAIAPKFTLRRGVTISPSLDISYGTIKGEVRSLYENNDTETDPYDVNSLESRLGLLISGRDFYFGAATSVFERVNSNQIYYTDGRGSYQTWLQAAYTFRKHRASKFSFTPQLAYLIFEHNSFNTELGTLLHAFNLNFQYDKYLAGINNTGVHLGVETGEFRFIAGALPWSSKGESPYRINGQASFYNMPVGPFSAANVSFSYNL